MAPAGDAVGRARFDEERVLVRNDPGADPERGTDRDRVEVQRHRVEGEFHVSELLIFQGSTKSRRACAMAAAFSQKYALLTPFSRIMEVEIRRFPACRNPALSKMSSKSCGTAFTAAIIPDQSRTPSPGYQWHSSMPS